MPDFTLPPRKPQVEGAVKPLDGVPTTGRDGEGMASRPRALGRETGRSGDLYGEGMLRRETGRSGDLHGWRVAGKRARSRPLRQTWGRRCPPPPASRVSDLAWRAQERAPRPRGGRWARGVADHAASSVKRDRLPVAG